MSEFATSLPPPRQTGGERFEIRGRLGAGGLGIVYRAFDRERGAEVALKTLRQVTGASLYRFKREFRTLADLAHPNLVTLHELHTFGGEWFLTMELIDGVSFLDWARPHEPADHAADEPALETIEEPEPDRGHTEATKPSRAARAPAVSTTRQRLIEARPRLDRLDECIYQLVDTVHALHRLGKLHRDLKPSNVLVEASGRVVVLDFGLIADLNAATPEYTHEHRTSAVGTPAYMSPEQAADLPLTAASDLYSVGVMLYEALTGRRPVDLIGRDLRGPLPAPHLIAMDVPDHLDRLCMQLLRVDPRERPDGAAVLAALGRSPSPASLALERTTASTPFVGREAELETLRRALEETRTGVPVAVLIRGASGMGKTSLLRQFLDESSLAEDVVVLRGRCFERESVPFKTLDATVDALATHLMQMPPHVLQSVLPRDVATLARLFPVLLRVPAVAEPAVRSFFPPDPLELRRRGFGALRELLRRLAELQPVVLAVDDVQWGDEDSGTFFADLLHHPDAPAMLLIACYRSEDEDVTPLLAALRRGGASLARDDRASRLRDLTLGPLSVHEARRVVEAVRGESHVPVDDIVRESGGSLIFLSELARFGGLDRGSRGGEGLSLDEVLRARIGRLPDDARLLLAVCAAAARPLASRIALRAAGLDGEGGVVTSLCAERLLRARRPADSAAELETYHDRIRTAVLARLSVDERRQVHAALALALESSEHDHDHQLLVSQWVEAGDPARSAYHAEAAALAAEERLAFHRAAELYALAIASGDHDAGARRALRTRLAHALAHAGRLDDCAAMFALAAEGAPAAERLELERLELEHLLRGGRLQIGLEKSRAVLAAVGFELPRTRLGQLASLIGQRFLLRLSGFEVEGEGSPPPAIAQRLDVLWSVSNGLGFVNPLYGQLLQLSYVRSALALRTPRHIGFAFSNELGYLALGGGKEWPRLELLRSRALAIAERTADKELLGVATAASGLAAFLCGQWREAATRLREGERVLRDECTRVRWQLDLTENFRISALWMLGEIVELVRLVPIYVRAAEERGDAYALRGLRSWRGNNFWLVLDRPDEARAQVQAVSLERAAGQPAQLTHFYEMLAHTQIDLYDGNAAAAHARVEAMWTPLKRALLLRIQAMRIDSTYLRARAAVALACDPSTDGEPGQRRALLKLATASARRLEREDSAWSAPLAAMVRAAVAERSGEPERAVAELAEAAMGFDAAHMALYAAAARARRGALLGGDEGAKMVALAESFMRAQAIVDPAKMVRMLAPGGG